MKDDRGVIHSHGDEDNIDGCICDIAYDESEALTDEELPPTGGGIEAVVADAIGDEDHIDGCDLDFDADDVTIDEELPTAAGGVGEAAVQGGD